MLAIKISSLQKKNAELAKVDSEAAAVQLLRWEVKADKRAAKAAGLVEQAESVQNDYDALNALANYEANRRIGYSVLKDWSKAFFGAIEFGSAVYAICERDFLDEELFTVGEYLELVSKVSKPQAETYAERARRIGDFWEYSFTLDNWAEKNAL